MPEERRLDPRDISSPGTAMFCGTLGVIASEAKQSRSKRLNVQHLLLDCFVGFAASQ